MWFWGRQKRALAAGCGKLKKRPPEAAPEGREAFFRLPASATTWCGNDVFPRGDGGIWRGHGDARAVDAGTAAQRNGQRREDKRARPGPRSGSGSTLRGRPRGGRSARERRLACGFNARRGSWRFSIQRIQSWGSLPAAVSPAKSRVPFPFFSEPRASCARPFSESRDRPARELERTL